MSENNTVCESNINNDNKCKKQSLTVNTNYVYFKYNYEKAIETQRIHFNWNQKRMCIPKCKDVFDYKLIIFDYYTGDYVRYYNNFEIEKVENVEKETNSYKNNKYESVSQTPLKNISDSSSGEIINNSLLKKENTTNSCCSIQ